jgi:uncharacterized protein
MFSKMSSVNNDKLEALSLEELYALADRTGLDLPPGLERPFVIEEIIDALEDESEERRVSQGEALRVDEKKFSELRIDELSVEPVADEAMTARYNETMIRAIVRDPSWAFAYWDVSDADLVALRGDEGTAGLFLRVAEIGSGEASSGAASTPDTSPAAAGSQDAHRDYFDIPVADNDLQWYINLPRSGVRFRIDLCARRQGPINKLRVLARSNEVESPRQTLSPPENGLSEASYELIALSGIEDLPIEDGQAGNPHRILQSGSGRLSDRAD